jgi:hypothetical protein
VNLSVPANLAFRRRIRGNLENLERIEIPRVDNKAFSAPCQLRNKHLWVLRKALSQLIQIIHSEL